MEKVSTPGIMHLFKAGERAGENEHPGRKVHGLNGRQRNDYLGKGGGLFQRNRRHTFKGGRKETDGRRGGAKGESPGARRQRNHAEK